MCAGGNFSSFSSRIIEINEWTDLIQNNYYRNARQRLSVVFSVIRQFSQKIFFILNLNVKLSLQVPMNFLLILESVFRGRGVLHFGEVLKLLQFLELFVVANVCIVCGQAHQIVH